MGQNVHVSAKIKFSCLIDSRRFLISVCPGSTGSGTTTTPGPGPASGTTRWTSGADRWPPCTGRTRGRQVSKLSYQQITGAMTKISVIETVSSDNKVN